MESTTFTASASIASPFAPFVAFATATAAADGEGMLYPEEQRALTPGAVEVRRLHFTLGRVAARRALLRLLGQEHPIPRATDGRPLWPEGVVGAITHSGDLGAAAVATRQHCHGIGLDLERRDRVLRTNVRRMVCREAELPWVEGGPDNTRLLMLFSAKEAIFKAFYPMQQVWLGFHEAELEWRGEPGVEALTEARGFFEARLLKDAAADYPAGYGFQVGCVLSGEWIMAHALIAASPQATQATHHPRGGG